MKKQYELLLGKFFELISPNGSSRPTVHVVLIDAFDECRNHRDEGKTTTERCALLRVLLNLATNVLWIKVIITSRREPDIGKVIGDASSGVNRININDIQWGTDADIRAFIEVNRKRWTSVSDPARLKA